MCIVSYSNEFIFIKTRKTGGTSIEVILQRLCSDKDVVTPINPPNPEHQPRNFERKSLLGKPKIYFNHMTARQVRDFEGKFFDKAFTFCFERHPIDKCLSQFAMLKNSPHHRRADIPRDWESYLEKGDFPIDVDKYTDASGRLMVDKIYKYEDYNQSLLDVFQRLGLPPQPIDVFEKSGFRSGIPSFEDVNASADQKKVIFEAFAETLRHVDYS